MKERLIRNEHTYAKRTGSKGIGNIPPANGLTFIDAKSVQRKENKTGMPRQGKASVNDYKTPEHEADVIVQKLANQKTIQCVGNNGLNPYAKPWGRPSGWLDHNAPAWRPPSTRVVTIPAANAVATAARGRVRTRGVIVQPNINPIGQSIGQKTFGSGIVDSFFTFSDPKIPRFNEIHRHTDPNKQPPNRWDTLAISGTNIRAFYNANTKSEVVAVHYY